MIHRPVVARALLANVLLACAAFADEFQPSTIVDAVIRNDVVGAGQAGVYSVPMSVVTLLIGPLKVTGQYLPATLSGPKSASQLIVGDSVQARVDGKWLYFIVPTGQTVKARIIRQERVAPQ